MQQITIEALRLEELKGAAGVLASAMCPNPIHVAVFSWQPGSERDLQVSFFATGLGRLLEGTLVAKQADEIVGVMCYVRSPSCGMTHSEAQQLLPRLQSMFGGRTARIMEWRSAWARRDPGEPHWHFGPFGVLPEEQGKALEAGC